MPSPPHGNQCIPLLNAFHILRQVGSPGPYLEHLRLTQEAGLPAPGMRMR